MSRKKLRIPQMRVYNTFGCGIFNIPSMVKYVVRGFLSFSLRGENFNTVWIKYS